MRNLIRVFNFYLDASIHVAFAVVSLVYITSLFLGIPANEHLIYYIFFATIPSYNFIKYGVEAEKYFLVSNKYHKVIQFFSFLSLSFALYHGFFLNLGTWMGIGILMLLTGLYALPVLPAGQKLRSLGLLKIVLVALIWSGTTVCLPLLTEELPFSWDATIEALQRFLLVLVLLVPFEIRDLKYDSPRLRTLPQRWGEGNSKIIGMVAAVFFFFLTFMKDGLHPPEVMSKGFLTSVLIITLLITKREQSRYFSAFWVEAIPIFWAGLAWVLQHPA